MSTHPATARSLNAELAEKIRLAEKYEDSDLPDEMTIERGLSFLAAFSTRFPHLRDVAFVGVGRDGSIEVVVTLPRWSYTIFVDPDETDLELVLMDRETEKVIDEGSVTIEQVLDHLAIRAA